MKKKVLLLSGYDAASHRYWRNLLSEKLPEFDWTQLAMDDRHFFWRVRGNSLSFAFEHRDLLSQDYDLLLVTSMVDLSSLRGFCPSLSQIPTLVYFHENQFAYPLSEHRSNLVNVQLTSIYTALCAEHLLFNSNYNKDSFLSGAQSLLKRLPDHIPRGLVEQLASRAEVLAVPIDVPEHDKPNPPNMPPHIVWNHRWEYDKQPEVFFDALTELKLAGYQFRLHILGQSFRKRPECFDKAKEFFKDEIDTFGYQDKQRYREILATADFVVSSALHDFQGLSLQEGIAYGCIPVAPNRVAYPEYIPESELYETGGEPSEESHHLFLKLSELINSGFRSKADVSCYRCDALIPEYQKLILKLICSSNLK